jgi:hypothetical protein
VPAYKKQKPASAYPLTRRTQQHRLTRSRRRISTVRLTGSRPVRKRRIATKKMWMKRIARMMTRNLEDCEEDDEAETKNQNSKKSKKGHRQGCPRT